MPCQFLDRAVNLPDKVAIIDLRGPDPGAFHDAYRSWAIRSRLEQRHGTSANHVIWFGPSEPLDLSIFGVGGA